MRITKRVVIIKETKDRIDTRITESIVEDDECHMMPVIAFAPDTAETGAPDVKIQCNICTQVFPYFDERNPRCPACDSGDVSWA